MPADVPVAVADPRPRSRLPARSICNSGYKIVCLQGSSTRIHLKMTRFFFLLAALPYFAGSAAAHPAILPDSSAVVRLDTAASGRTVYLRVDEPPRFQGGDVLAFRDWVFRHLCFGGEMFREGVEARLVVSFVVGRQGAVEEPEVVSSTDERCSAEVLRVLASAPRWTPGRLGNVAVSSWRCLRPRIRSRRGCRMEFRWRRMWPGNWNGCRYFRAGICKVSANG